jgi:hypothetical protein
MARFPVISSHPARFLLPSFHQAKWSRATPQPWPSSLCHLCLHLLLHWQDSRRIESHRECVRPILTVGQYVDGFQAPQPVVVSTQIGDIAGTGLTTRRAFKRPEV